MPRNLRRTFQRAFACSLVLGSFLALNQILQAQSADGQPTSQTGKSANGAINRVSGTDASSGIQYVRFILNGSHPIASGASVVARPDETPPILIAQCSLRPGGKYFFEMFATFGGPADLSFYPPWKPRDPHDLFAPPTQKVVMTMEFLGYVHIKPFRRQWRFQWKHLRCTATTRPARGRPTSKNHPGSFATWFHCLPCGLRWTIARRNSRLLHCWRPSATNLCAGPRR